jgi:hypothetical protein
MKCKFEERQYEQPLNFELAWRGKIFPAGQVLENTIGIDAALFSRDPTFWRLWNTQRWWLSFRRLWKHGVRLKSELWEDAKNKLDNVKFPKFKCNVFIQHKRPEYITSPRGREFNFWRQKYFRYDINTDQRDILSKLEQRSFGISKIIPSWLKTVTLFSPTN